MPLLVTKRRIRLITVTAGSTNVPSSAEISPVNPKAAAMATTKPSTLNHTVLDWYQFLVTFSPPLMGSGSRLGVVANTGCEGWIGVVLDVEHPNLENVPGVGHSRFVYDNIVCSREVSTKILGPVLGGKLDSCVHTSSRSTQGSSVEDVTGRSKGLGGGERVARRALNHSQIG